MTRYLRRPVCLFAIAMLAAAMPSAQGRQATASNQKIDEAYTAKIKEFLQDPRITTELVDHLPASDTVPSPLKFLGRVVGTILTKGSECQRGEHTPGHVLVMPGRDNARPQDR